MITEIKYIIYMITKQIMIDMLDWCLNRHNTNKGV